MYNTVGKTSFDFPPSLISGSNIASRALKGIFDVFLTSKRENVAFSPHPLHAMMCRCSSYLKKIAKTPTSNGGDRGGVWSFLFFEVLPIEYNVSTNFSPIVRSDSRWHFEWHLREVQLYGIPTSHPSLNIINSLKSLAAIETIVSEDDVNCGNANLMKISSSQW